VKGPVVQKARERVAPRQFGQAARDLSEVQEQAVVKSLASPSLAVSLQHATESEKLRHDFCLAQTEALALARVVCCELSRVAPGFERGDERRQRP